MRGLLVGLLAVPALVAGQAPATQPVTIVTEFGGAARNPADELSRVRSVLRMPDGRFVVANGRPMEVRVYSPAGERLGVLGRQGEGPGEYRYGARVQPWSGDSVRLLSTGTRQWLLYGLDGSLIRQWEATSEEVYRVVSFSLTGSAVIRHGAVGGTGCSLELLRHLAPARGDTLSEAMTDDRGRVWLRPFGTSRWTVHGANGSVIARLDLPPRFRATQFDGAVVVGVREDDDGFEHVTVVHHGLADVGLVTSPECSSTPSGIEPVRAAELKTGMRNAMVAAEAFYADRGRYPASADEYPDALKPPGAEFRVLDGDNESFAISILDRETRYRCIVSVGSGNDLDGVLLCGR